VGCSGAPWRRCSWYAFPQRSQDETWLCDKCEGLGIAHSQDENVVVIVVSVYVDDVNRSGALVLDARNGGFVK
jgi:hypothetical protein